MNDDEEWHVLPNGVKVKGKHHPRIVDGVDTLTGEKLGPEELTPEEAEARSVEHRRQRARSIFTDPVWPTDQVVSWIGYRDIEAIEERFAPALYKDSRPVVEGMPRIALLRALQEDRLRAIRQQGKLVDRVHPDEWAHVRREWSIGRWHRCLFARSDVIALWPAVEHKAKVVNTHGHAVEDSIKSDYSPALSSLQPATKPLQSRRRGRKPKERDEVVNKMLPMLEKGIDLETWSDLALEAEFKRAPGTCRSALQHALALAQKSD